MAPAAFCPHFPSTEGSRSRTECVCSTGKNSAERMWPCRWRSLADEDFSDISTSRFPAAGCGPRCAIVKCTKGYTAAIITLRVNELITLSCLSRFFWASVVERTADGSSSCLSTPSDIAPKSNPLGHSGHSTDSEARLKPCVRVRSCFLTSLSEPYRGLLQQST